MAESGRTRFLVPAVAMAAVLGLGDSPAHAQNLLDVLFGGGLRREREARQLPEPPRPNPAPRPAAAPAPAPTRISAPTYYAYKADRLVRVSFDAILARPRPATFEPRLGGGFDDALHGLDGFDLRAEREIAAAIEEYYAKHPGFIWVSGSSAGEAALQAIEVLGEAGSYGLDPADYAVAAPAPGFDLARLGERAAELMRFEMTLSARVLRYVRDAHSGRIDPNRLSGYHDFPAKPLDLVAVLDRLAHTRDVRAYLESRHPQNERYEALRAELEALRADSASADDAIAVDPKLLLKPGQSSPELPGVLALFARDEAWRGQFSEILAAHAGSETYDQALVPAVKAAQAAKGLEADGVIGPRTVAAFAGLSRADRIRKLVIALEQLRWHPSDFGSPYVFINQPAFTASYVEGGVETLTMRVVVGKTSNQTSFFHDEIERVEYNPYWGVPQSILVNEMLPRLRGDPGYLDRAGYEVTDSSGRRIPSSAIDWSQFGSKVPYSVRQSPSEANALGELKILFPNKHAIYMHDTPQKALFQRDVRAFSHGCVRLHDPHAMAAAVLGKSVEHVAARIAQGHSSERLERPIPVYVAYFTAWPDATGKVGYFADVYGRDERVEKAFEVVASVRTPSG